MSSIRRSCNRNVSVQDLEQLVNEFSRKYKVRSIVTSNGYRISKVFINDNVEIRFELNEKNPKIVITKNFGEYHINYTGDSISIQYKTIIFGNVRTKSVNKALVDVYSRTTKNKGVLEEKDVIIDFYPEKYTIQPEEFDNNHCLAEYFWENSFVQVPVDYS